MKVQGWRLGKEEHQPRRVLKQRIAVVSVDTVVVKISLFMALLLWHTANVQVNNCPILFL